MNPGTLAWVGGIGGSLVGIAGGALVTYFSIRNTANDRARRFMIKCSVFTWTTIALCLALPVVLWLAHVAPMWVLWVCFGFFYVFLFPFIIWVNKRVTSLSQPRGWEAAWQHLESQERASGSGG